MCVFSLSQDHAYTVGCNSLTLTLNTGPQPYKLNPNLKLKTLTLNPNLEHLTTNSNFNDMMRMVSMRMMKHFTPESNSEVHLAMPFLKMWPDHDHAVSYILS